MDRRLTAPAWPIYHVSTAYGMSDALEDFQYKKSLLMHLLQSGDAKFEEVYLRIQNLIKQVLEMASGKCAGGQRWLHGEESE